MSLYSAMFHLAGFHSTKRYEALQCSLYSLQWGQMSLEWSKTGETIATFTPFHTINAQMITLKASPANSIAALTQMGDELKKKKAFQDKKH